MPPVRPYGFMIFADGSYKVVKDWGGHADAIYPQDPVRVVKQGGIRMAFSWTTDGFVGEVINPTPRALNTAKDLATFYDTPFTKEIAKWYT